MTNPDRPTMPARCPKCGSVMVIVKLICPQCDTEVQGEFTPCPVCRLGEENQDFFWNYLACRGNVKKLERLTGLSYPTVRNRVAGLFKQLLAQEPGLSPKEILLMLRQGKLTVEEAEKLLKQ